MSLVPELQDGTRVPAPSRFPGFGTLAGPTLVGRHFGRSREWGRRLLREWEAEQKRDGLPRVIRMGANLYTTVVMLEHYAPRRDRALERRVAALEADLERAFARVAELERALGRRR